MMNRKNGRFNLLVVVWLLSLVAGIAGAADNRAAFDQYNAAYQAYHNAVARNLPKAELQTFVDAYQKAKTAYESTLNQPTGTDGDILLTNVSESAMAGEAGAGASLLEPQASTAAAGSPIASYKAVESAELEAVRKDSTIPAELKTILEDVWGVRSRRSPDSAIQRLEKYVANNPGSPSVHRAKYELAKAYEWLKKDNAKAEATLKQLAGDPKAGTMRQMATDRLKYLASVKQHGQWKTALQSKSDVKDAAYKSYRDTSFFAIPVKIFRYGSYFTKLLSFQSTQADYKKFQLWFEETGSPFVPPVDIIFDQFATAGGNGDPESSVRLIYTNSESWYTRWKLLNEAKRSIDVQYFIVDDDIFGMSLAGLFLKKAKEGVKIRFMMDARGTKGFTRKLQGQDFMQELAQYPNVEIKVFNPVHQNFLTLFMDLRKVMSSNHDKIVVIDEEYAIVGGRNVSKDYFVDPEDHPTAYRDCDVLIHSTEVARALDAAFTEEFTGLKQLEIVKDLWGNVDIMSKEMEAARLAMETWIQTGRLYNPGTPDKRTVKALKKFNEELAQYKHLVGYSSFDFQKGAHDAPVKIVDKHSLAGPRNDITDELVRYIDGARTEIVIQNPYVVLTERAEAALKRAARRRIPIIFHTNSPISTDSLATQAMFYRDWKSILKDIPSARIFTFYQKRKLHAKNFVFDGLIGVVGTYNMDYLSEEVNSEVVATIKSLDFAQELRGGIMSDVANSKEYRIKVLPNGKVEVIFGPDDLASDKSWLIRTLSKLGWIRPLI